jgi:hypothetical protein
MTLEHGEVEGSRARALAVDGEVGHHLRPAAVVSLLGK